MLRYLMQMTLQVQNPNSNEPIWLEQPTVCHSRMQRARLVMEIGGAPGDSPEGYRLQRGGIVSSHV